MGAENNKAEVIVKNNNIATALLVFIIAFILGMSTLYYVNNKYGLDRIQSVLSRITQVKREEKTTGPEKTQSVYKETSSYDSTKEQIPQIVAKVQDSVVSIAIMGNFVAPDGFTIKQNSEQNIGSGFVVNKDGLIVTNRHVVNKEAVYKIVTRNGQSLPVKKIIRDPINDIAFVYADLKNSNVKLNPLPLGDSDKLLLGQSVIAIGTPLGEFTGSVTVGVVGGLHRSVNAESYFMGGSKKYENVIQTDASINPGNSGGPLVNLGGEVIGVNFAKIANADNISFALPINLVKQRLDEYKKFGKLRQPFLGIMYVYISPAERFIFGALVQRVVPNSPADKAGIKPGDVIMMIDNDKVLGNLGTLLYKHNIGDTIKVKIARLNKNGEPEFKTLKVTITDKDSVLGKK